MTSKSILILNGPGFGEACDRAGISEAEVKSACEQACLDNSLALDYHQAVDLDDFSAVIHRQFEHHNGLIFNPAGCTGTGAARTLQAALDEVALLARPVIETHLGNIFTDGSGSSPLGDTRCASAFICGFGLKSYLLAIRAASRTILQA